MTALIWFAIIFLVIELIFIYIVIHKAYRIKHTIDPIDTGVKEIDNGESAKQP